MIKKMLYGLIVLIFIIILCFFIKTSSTPDKTTFTTTSSSIVEVLNTSAPTEQSIKCMYIVTYEIKQTHFTLDLSEHAKDHLNAATIEIPVDKEYYNSLRIGQVIENDVRVGSLVMKGSLGRWKISVKDKKIEVIE